MKCGFIIYALASYGACDIAFTLFVYALEWRKLANAAALAY